MQFTLYAFFRAERHVVTQVVEAVFVVGAVCDICCVGFTFSRSRHTWQVNANGHTQELKQRAVIFRIALGQVVVYGDDMNPFAA